MKPTLNRGRSGGCHPLKQTLAILIHRYFPLCLTFLFVSPLQLSPSLPSISFSFPSSIHFAYFTSTKHIMERKSLPFIFCKKCSQTCTLRLPSPESGDFSHSDVLDKRPNYFVLNKCLLWTLNTRQIVIGHGEAPPFQSIETLSIKES